MLLRKDVVGFFQVDVRAGFWRSFVGQHRAKNRIYHHLGLAARAGDMQVFAVLLPHADIVLLRRKKVGARIDRAPTVQKLKDAVYALAGFSPRVKPGAGRSSGRTTLGSVPGAACGGGVGGVRGLSGSGFPSMSSFTSLASMTSRSRSAWATRSSVS